MTYLKRIVCLSNSYKAPLGRCIVGKEFGEHAVPGRWIRPISDRPKGELSSTEYAYQSGGRPKILDVIDVPLLRELPRNPQAENHVVAPSGRWTKIGKITWHDLETFVDQPERIWINSQHTRDGSHDCISAEEAAKLEGSLLLIRTDEFTVEAVSSQLTDRRTYRGRFFYREKYYNFSITDPAIHERFASQQEGDYPLTDVYLCLSLTQPYEIDNRCHKLVAAVIANPAIANSKS